MGIKRIIPCLDISKGKVVKGINFIGLREVGDPLEYALEYGRQGADEIVFLNISATKDSRKEMLNLVETAAKRISVPIIFGGGIGSVGDARQFLQAGAKKISINSAAVKNPQLIDDVASKYGKEKIVLAIDGKEIGKGRYTVMISGGKVDTGLDLIEWAEEAERLGAGEILLTSMNSDGVKEGFDIQMIDEVCNAVKIPVIASGGCGTVGHFVKVFQNTACDAALAASIFHYGDLTVNAVKEALNSNGVNVNVSNEGVCA